MGMSQCAKALGLTPNPTSGPSWINTPTEPSAPTATSALVYPMQSKAQLKSSHTWEICRKQVQPERYTELMERSRNCPEGNLFIEMFGGGDPKEN